MMKVLHIAQRETGCGRFAAAPVLHSVLPYLGVLSYLAAAELSVGTNRYEVVPLFDEERRDCLSDAAKRLFGEVDMIHLHTTDEAIVTAVLRFARSLEVCPQLVWSVADANAYTGGCYYSAVCQSWRTDCGACLIQDTSQKATALQAKRSLYSGLPMTVVASSRWLASQLADSVLGDKARFFLPLPVDKALFFPGDQRTARLALGLPVDSLIVLVEAAGKEAFAAVYHAVRSFVDRLEPVLVVCLHCVSADAVRSVEQPSAAVLGEYYRAADLYVDLRQAGTYPEVAEAMACGCPSLVLDCGAAQEATAPDCGFVIDQVAGERVFDVLSQMVNNEAGLVKLRQRCLAKAADHCDTIVMARGYVDLYQRLAARQSVQGEVAVEQAARFILLGGGRKLLSAKLKATLAGLPAAQGARRDRIVDKFCFGCLTGKDVLTDYFYLWDVIALWLESRSSADFRGDAASEQAGVYRRMITALRAALVRWFKAFDLSVYTQVEERYFGRILRLWHDVFLNPQAFLHTLPAKEERASYSEDERRQGYPYVLLQTMAVPYDEGEAGWDAAAIAELPNKSLFFIFMMWLIQLPPVQATREQEQRAVQYFHDFMMALLTKEAALTTDESKFLAGVFAKALQSFSARGVDCVPLTEMYCAFAKAMLKQPLNDR